MKIDARGKNCPIPVIMAKKEIDKNRLNFTVFVDNEIAVENLKKLAQNKHYGVEVKSTGSDYSVDFICDGSLVIDDTLNELEKISAEEVDKPISNWVLFMGKEIIGSGDAVLGGNLMKMYFYTLAQGDCLPSTIVFMNDGVKLPCLNEQVVEHLKTLTERGCEILVCGACLEFYQLSKKLQIGTVSNMYDITERMNSAVKVVTL